MNVAPIAAVCADPEAAALLWPCWSGEDDPEVIAVVERGGRSWVPVDAVTRRMERDDKAIERAMQKLRSAEHARLEAIAELVRLGAVRSRSVVGDFGEEIAKRYYGARELAPRSNAGYDLVTPQGTKVQVKTLRCTPGNFRTTIGRLQENYDVLFAIRLNEDYTPMEAIEVPKRIVKRYFGRGRVTWTNILANDPSTRRIPGHQLATLL